MLRLLERHFIVKCSIETTWAHLEKVEQWPSWARHIQRIDLRPRGTLTLETKGTIRLSNGIRSTFRMEQLSPGKNWKWVGPFLWLRVHYDHQFASTSADETEVRFVLDGEGFGVGFFGRVFAAIYARNLDRAIPHLVRELETK